jgi:hypothetical protein
MYFPCPLMQKQMQGIFIHKKTPAASFPAAEAFLVFLFSNPLLHCDRSKFPLSHIQKVFKRNFQSESDSSAAHINFLKILR